jgi:hypothetical protein
MNEIKEVQDQVWNKGLQQVYWQVQGQVLDQIWKQVDLQVWWEVQEQIQGQANE